MSEKRAAKLLRRKHRKVKSDAAWAKRRAKRTKREPYPKPVARDPVLTPPVTPTPTGSFSSNWTVPGIRPLDYNKPLKQFKEQHVNWKREGF